jgi:FlaA1/EpsC-like NDP-sugar epimerase
MSERAWGKMGGALVNDSRLRTFTLSLVELGRHQKRVLLAVNDLLLLGAALWVAFSTRLGEFYWPTSISYLLLLLAGPIIGVATFFALGLYRIITRYMGNRALLRIGAAVGLSMLIWALIVLLSGVPGIPRSVVLLYAIIGAGLVWGSRLLAAWLLKGVGVRVPRRLPEDCTNVVIYGAGPTGVELAKALWRSGHHIPVGFIDTDSSLWGQYAGGLKVFRPERLPGLIENRNVKEVLLAMPEAQRRERARILQKLQELPVRVRKLPAIEDIATGRVTINDLRPVDAEDLLGRDPIPPDLNLLARNTRGKSVLVTGAGGSIGSELVRQILKHWPRRLVLLDATEAALYEIEQEAQEILKGEACRAGDLIARNTTEIVAALANVIDTDLVHKLIKSNAVETIYHAAAYKHVPIVEHNPVVGLRNNTLGTAVVAEAAEACGVERFVLISTDKAVRPTSIMGASKRLAELILQAKAAEGGGHTVFTMVRFGNVLDSSGSVVRRFRKQIEAGGPLTVTHPDMIRYFMSIPEAASLVIQAGAMATGGEVFVLDMGEPVRIDDLARSMIRLMGLEVRDADNPDGDIAIAYTGLRDGEKLNEELLIGEDTLGTEHPRILRSHEPYLASPKLQGELKNLREAMDRDDGEAIRVILKRVVEGYRPERRRPSPTLETLPLWAPAMRTLH